MLARDKKVHSPRFVTKSTNYYFLIELITGWHLRPIFRLILTGYIYSRHMYDGIEHFYYAQSYESLYELCTAYRLKDIKTFTNKSAKSTFELIHLIKTSLFSRFDLYSNRRHVNRGTSPLEHLYSRDSSIQWAQNLVLYWRDTSIQGRGDTFSWFRIPGLTFIQGTP